MPWYRSLGTSQKGSLTAESKGLPLIISRWAELSLEQYNEDILSKEARGVLEGKYFSLVGRIESATDDEKKLLYAIGLSNRPRSALALTLLCDQPMEKVEHLSSRWVQQTVLRRVPSENSTPCTFTFDHEAKRNVALEVLFQTSREKKRVQKQFLKFAILNSNTGLPELDHFIDLGLTLCSEKNLAGPRSVVQMLEDLLLMIADAETNFEPQLDPEVLRILSPSIGIAYLSMLLHCKRSEKSDVLGRVNTI